MQRFLYRALRALFLFAIVAGPRAGAQEQPSSTALVISIAEQKLALLRDGGLMKKFKISTSKFGIGDTFGSYKTPIGRMRVCEKIGDDLSIGAVLKARHATGEVLPANAPGRDPIVTRILWLEGLEPQNSNARQRGIYIHGTVEEKRIGEAASYGCIRMRSLDVMEIYEETPLASSVTILAGKFPRYPKYTPPKPVIIAAVHPPKASPSPSPTPAILAKTTTPAAPAPAAAPASLAPRIAPSATITKVERPAKTEEPANPMNPIANMAFHGSILDAGLPEGPKIPTLPAPAEPKDVARFKPLDPGLPADSAFSLQGISQDLSPVRRAAELDAETREEEAKEKRAAADDSNTPAQVAFRAGQAAAKQKR